MTGVYVAGSSKEIDRAERVIYELRSRGVEITHDWTASMRKHGPEAELDEETLLRELRLDLVVGVQLAEHVLVLAPISMSTGVWVELGVAWGSRVKIHSAGDLAICPWLRLCADMQHATDDEAISWLGEFA